MAGYDSYRDTNGVTWTIAQGGNNLLATVLDNANPRYYPPAEDFFQRILTPGDGTMDEVVRVAFIKLREQIDAYAAAHASGVALAVTAKPGGWGTLLLVALGLYALSKGGRRRRR